MKKRTQSYITHIYRHIVLLVFILAFIASSWSLLKPGLGMGHDLNHQARIFEMSQGLQDGNFPVIWSQNLAYGYGMPLFQFYAPLPYFLGAIFYLLGFTLATSVELLLLLATLVTLLGSYLLGKELFNNRWAALLTMVLVGLAPYRAVDLFVRAALSEAWAIALLPWVLLGVVKVVKNRHWGWLVLAISYCCLILSHNLTAIIATPFILLFSISIILIEKQSLRTSITTAARLATASLLGLALSAFYTIPAIVEKHYTQLDRFILGSYYDFRQHFLYIRQFFQPWGDWEYGGSGWGPEDEMSFFLGYPQLLILTIAGFLIISLTILVLIQRRRQAINSRNYVLLLVLFFLTSVSLIATLLKTQPLWELLPFLKYVQFPWRFLSITVVFGSLLAGAVTMLVVKAWRPLFVIGVTFLALVLNSRYFQSEKYESFDQHYKDFAYYIRTQTSNNLFDYLPKDITFLNNKYFYLYKDKDAAFESIEVPTHSLFTASDAAYLKPSVTLNTSTRKRFQLDLNEEQTITLNIAYYPGWTVSTNRESLAVQPNQYGLVSFTAPSGSTDYQVMLHDTAVRFWSKTLTLFAVCLTLLWMFLTLRAYRKPNRL